MEDIEDNTAEVVVPVDHEEDMSGRHVITSGTRAGSAIELDYEETKPPKNAQNNKKKRNRNRNRNNNKNRS